MPDKWSQLRRNRDRKPWDPFGKHLNRTRGQAPSTSRNSERMEQWRGGRDKNMGRRGKKKRKQDQRVKKQRRTNEEERRQELRRRPALAKKAKAKIARIAQFCEDGYVITAHKPHTKAASSHEFTADGLVQKKKWDWVYDPKHFRNMRKVVSVQVQPWEEMSSRFLRMILRSAWAPKNPKTVLDQIIVATGGFDGS